MRKYYGSSYKRFEYPGLGIFGDPGYNLLYLVGIWGFFDFLFNLKHILFHQHCGCGYDHHGYDQLGCVPWTAEASHVFIQNLRLGIGRQAVDRLSVP